MRIPVLSVIAFGAVLGCVWFIGTKTKTQASESACFSTVKEEATKPFSNTKPSQETERTKEELTDAYVSPYQFEELHAINPDIIAWLTVPGTAIDYPIVFNQTDDYLHQNLKRESSYSGTPYLDKTSKHPMEDPINVIYGHHMKNQTMFAAIDRYNDADFFNEHSEIHLYLEHKELVLHPVAVITGKADASIRAIQSANDLKDFAKDKSVTVGSLPLNEASFYVFVTCNYSGHDFRTYLVCTEF